MPIQNVFFGFFLSQISFFPNLIGIIITNIINGFVNYRLGLGLGFGKRLGLVVSRLRVRLVDKLF